MSEPVEAIEVWVLQYPYAPHARENDSQMVELIGLTIQTHNGVTGTGFTYSLCGGGRAAAQLLIDAIAPRLLSTGLADRRATIESLRWDLRRLGPGLVSMTLSAADIALWDAHARSLQLPLHRVLGSERDRVPAFASGRYSPTLPVSVLVDNAHADITRGFSAIKLRIGGRPIEQDLARVEAVRRTTPDRVTLIVDAAELYTPRECHWLAPRLADLGVTTFEEPMLSELRDDYAALQRSTKLQLAFGEHFYRPSDFREAVSHGCARIYNPDVAIVGGIDAFLEVASTVASAEAMLAPHLVSDLHVSLAAAVDNVAYVEEFPFTNHLWQQPISYADGHVLVPQGPGTGLDFDPEVFAELCTWSTGVRL